jgi:phenylacetaldehyde dehydrogenase
LGGKSPVIVMPDADVAVAAVGAANAIFFNSGQICVAGSRLYAHRDIFDSVLEALAKSAEHWTLGPSLDPGSRMGPLISRVQQERVLGYIEQGRQAGASVVSCGDAPENDGYYVRPTIFAGVTAGMGVVREEIFGPVLVAQRFDTIDEVVQAANDTPFGLAASVWTRDVSALHKLASRIKAGTVWGNCHAVMDPAVPFGGFKQSGIGREFGRSGIDAYTENKSVIVAL